ncbi:hypothetical protein [Methylopila sp. 73B]|uniref:hypothetical protein n=1 Tax=Methylopila sp. 73B TaxID=1120792 RepID=UPI0003609A18|nr:hypothetical protein [Methylopila sp. 73B]
MRKNSWCADGALNDNGAPFAGGAPADHSNVPLIVALGWNDVYGSNAVTAEADKNILLDCVDATAPGAKVIILGMGAPPDEISKNQNLGDDFAGDGASAGRTVSQRVVF